MSNILDGAAMLAAATVTEASLVSKTDDLAYDIGVLAAFDYHPLESSALASNKEATLLHAATENAQLLIKRIFELPVEKTDVGPVVRPDFCASVHVLICGSRNRTLLPLQSSYAAGAITLTLATFYRPLYFAGDIACPHNEVPALKTRAEGEATDQVADVRPGEGHHEEQEARRQREEGL
jgi:hypothetical protein